MPLGEFFWTNFLRRCRRELPVDETFDPYRYWDLDLVVVNPNMDPHLTGLLDDDMTTHCHEVGVRCASSGCVACYPDEAVA